MGIACKQCGAQVEAERECYATPMCFACLPPPKPLPKTYTQQHVDELTRERDDLRRHYDAAAPEHNLLALLDLYHDRQCAAERERDEALCRLDHAEADAEQAVSITISERDEARAEVERLKSRVQSISSSVEHHAKTAAASERAAIVAWLRAEAERFELHGRRTGEEEFWNQAAIERHDIADCIERGDHRAKEDTK